MSFSEIIYTTQSQIERAKRLKPHEIISILEDFRRLSKTKNQKPVDDKTILISLKVAESLLSEFREACNAKGLKYQTQIKQLMKDWLSK